MKKPENKGITLIALVITIIVLLILAGISISLLSGNNEILQKANSAQESTNKSQTLELLQLAVMGSYDDSGTLNAGTVKTNIEKEVTGVTVLNATFPLTVAKDDGTMYSISSKGEVKEQIDISTYVSLGDYVNYDPTYLDKNKTQSVNTNLLTYTSLVGSGTEHGNGFGNQTFTASSTIQWRVLNIINNKVYLISNTGIGTDTNSKYYIKGAVGYLYAEQELNEICKIYGYGYGADTSQITEFNVGGPLDTITRTITNSGARSMIMNDVNILAGITESDFITLDPNYGNTDNPSSNVYYPTMTTSSGKSNSAGAKNIPYTGYSYPKSYITNTTLQRIIFNTNYWVADRFTRQVGDVCYEVRILNGLNTGGTQNPCSANSSNIYDMETLPNYVRPIITINADNIDIENPTQNSDNINVWDLK